MTKRISGPFEDEERQVEWQKEVLRKADEWLKNLKDTFPHIKDEYKGYAADRINLLEWLIKQVKSSIKTH